MCLFPCVVAEVLSPYSTVTVAPPSDQESSSDTEIQFSLHTLDTAHLKEYDCSVKPRRRKGKGENISRKTEPKQKEPPVMGEAAKLWLEVVGHTPQTHMATVLVTSIYTQQILYFSFYPLDLG